MATMRDFIQQLPKAELHIHLEGSIAPTTLLEIEPALSLDEVLDRYQYDSFEGFLKNFGWVARHLQQPRHYAIALRRLLQHLETQNVRYAEITLSAGVVLRQQKQIEPIHEALLEAAAESPIRTVWIWDAVRQWGVEAAQRVAELAVAHRDRNVVAFGLGGDERNGPATDFAPVFQFARDHGLRLVCHAGEVTSAESVWQALAVGAERIGHGIRSIDDPTLVAHLAQHQIPLELNLSSNTATGAIPSMDHHPIRRLFDANVLLILNTDDPPMFHTTLNQEFEIAATTFQFTEAELAAIAHNGFRFAFQP